MNPLTRCLIALNWYYSRLLGVLAISYNVKTGEAKINLYITIYCLVANVLTIAIIAYFLTIMKIKTLPPGQADLHQKLYTFLTFVRIASILLTIASNWLKRKDFVRNLNALKEFRQDFLKKWPIRDCYKTYFNSRMQMKFFVGLICDIMVAFATVQILQNLLGIQNTLVLTILGIFSSILNVCTSHYFFIALEIHVLYLTISGELKCVLNKVGDLFRLQYSNRIGPVALNKHCCHLADVLDDLSDAHQKLQHLVDGINIMFYLQGCCAMLVLYLNNISVTYMAYIVLQKEDLWPQFDSLIWYFVPIALMCYYADQYLFIYLILHMVDGVDMPGALLKERLPWLPTLHQRLERSLQNYCLQMAAFPLNRHILYLFEITRPMVFATLSSTLSNAIVLMYYDYKVSKN